MFSSLKNSISHFNIIQRNNIQFKLLTKDIGYSVFQQKIIRNFSSQKDDPNQKNIQNQYIYDQKSLNQINSQEFIEKIQKMEKNEKKQKVNQANFKLPLFLCLTAGFTYFLWNNVPYPVLFKHFTISEYVNQNGYVHAIFLSSLSFQQFGHFIVYYPLMIGSMMLTSRYFSNKITLILFVSNSLISTAVTYAYEKYQANNKYNLLIPKCNGAVTPLAFSWAYLGLRPSHNLFGNKAFPYFIIPVTYLMYEYKEFQEANVHEICRPAHISAIVWGIFFGLAVKRLI